MTLGTATVDTGTPDFFDIVDVGNDWFFCWLEDTATATVTAATHYFRLHNGSSDSYTGDDTSGAWVFGAQLRQLPSSANYQYTSGSSRTVREVGFGSYQRIGVRHEEARTQLSLFVTTLDNGTGGWTETDATTTLNDDVSPSGETDATHIASTTGSTPCLISKDFTGTAAVYTFSLDVKDDNAGWIKLALDDGTTDHEYNFDIVNGTVGSAGTGSATPTIRYRGDGYYRCSVTALMIATTCTQKLYVTDADSGSDPDAGEAIWAWGTQVELGSYETSLVLAEGSSQARAVDNMTVAGSLFSISPNDGTLYAEVKNLDPSYTSAYIVELAAATRSAATFGLRFESSDTLRGYASGNAFENLATFDETTNPNYFSRFVMSASDNDFAATLNGNTVVTDITGDFLPSSASEFAIGQDTDNGTPATMIISELMYLPRDMTDAEILALSTQSENLVYLGSSDPAGDALLMGSGDYLLTQEGDYILL